LFRNRNTIDGGAQIMSKRNIVIALIFLSIFIGNFVTTQGQQTQKEFVEMDQSNDIQKPIPLLKNKEGKNRNGLSKICFVHHLTFRVKCLRL
jgi:hypothetical protein